MAGRFPLLADEHVPKPFLKTLKERGWTVLRVVDLEAELGQGTDDERVFAYAVEHGYVVLSSDERALWRPRQYRERGQPFRGMLCWPQRDRDRMSIGAALECLEDLAQEDDPFAYGYRFMKPRS